MTKLKIVSDYPKNLNELKQFEGQDKINNETKELPSIPRTSFIKQSVVLGAVTFIFAFRKCLQRRISSRKKRSCYW